MLVETCLWVTCIAFALTFTRTLSSHPWAEERQHPAQESEIKRDLVIVMPCVHLHALKGFAHVSAAFTDNMPHPSEAITLKDKDYGTRRMKHPRNRRLQSVPTLPSVVWQEERVLHPSMVDLLLHRIIRREVHWQRSAKCSYTRSPRTECTLHSTNLRLILTNMQNCQTLHRNV